MPPRGQNQVVDGQKRCKDCGLWQPVDAFDLMSRPSRPGDVYYFPRCKPCKKLYQVNYYQSRKQREPGWEKKQSRKATLARYGLTPEEYDDLLIAQDGRCAICKRRPGSTNGVDRHNLVVDHDHAAGTTRALLCDFCNRGLGIFRDDPELLMAAAAYLLEYSAQEGGG